MSSTQGVPVTLLPRVIAGHPRSSHFESVLRSRSRAAATPARDITRPDALSLRAAARISWACRRPPARGRSAFLHREGGFVQRAGGGSDGGDRRGVPADGVEQVEISLVVDRQAEGLCHGAGKSAEAPGSGAGCRASFGQCAGVDPGEMGRTGNAKLCATAAHRHTTAAPPRNASPCVPARREW